MSNRSGPRADGRRRSPSALADRGVEPLETRRLFTTAALLADLNTTPGTAGLDPQVAVGDVVFATRTASDGSRDVYSTDGTAAGTVRVAAHLPAAPGNFVRFGPSAIAFAAGSRVYVATAAANSARLVEQFDPADTFDGYAGASLAPFGNRLLVNESGGGSLNGDGLYVTDGTAAGTTQLSTTSTFTLYNKLTTAANGEAYFTDAGDGTTGPALWRTDGTAAGTGRVADGPVLTLGTAGNAVVYTTGNAGYGYSSGPVSLYAVAGPTAAPALVRTFQASSSYTADGVTLGGGFVFDAPSDAAANVAQVWRTDGTAAGTAPLATLAAGQTVGSITAGGPRAYFAVDDPYVAGQSEHGTVYVTDGTAAGTAALPTPDNLNSAGVEAAADGSAYELFSVAAGTNANGVAVDAEAVYHTDGASAPPVRLVVGGPSDSFADVVATPSAVYFATGYQSLTSAYATGWRAAATAADAGGPFNPPVPEFASSNPFDLVTLGDGVTSLFEARATTDGVTQVYRTDGTTAGTAPVTSLDATMSINLLTPAGHLAYFTVTTRPATDPYGTGTVQVWRTDGTAAGTFALTAPPSTLYAGPYSLNAVGDVAYFSTQTNYYDAAVLWRTDGSQAGTVTVGLAPGGTTQYSSAVAGGRMFFDGGGSFSSTAADAPTNGLYVADGSTAAPTLVLAADPGTFSNLMPLGDRVVYTTAAGLFVTDGTAAGTTELAAGSFLPNNGDPLHAFDHAVAGSTLYFAAAGQSVWRTDGTAAGTRQVFALPAPASSSTATVTSLTALGDKVVFAADDGAHGSELWVTDGTTAGTALLDDIDPGTAASAPTDFVAVGGQVFFTADDGVHGREPWQTDGTAAGTTEAADVVPGQTSGDPQDLVPLDGHVLFVADDAVHGRELWATVAGTPVISNGNPPTAALAAAVEPVNGAATIALAVTYADAVGFDAATLTSASAVTLTAPDGSTLAATSAVPDAGADPAHRTVTYTFAAPGGKLTAADNGTYAVNAAGTVVTDAAGLTVVGGTLGRFAVSVPTAGVTLAAATAVAGPAAAVGGAKGTARVTIRNAGTTTAAGTVTVQLLLSTTPTGAPGTTTLLTTTAVAVKLKAGGLKTAAVRFTYPRSAATGPQYVVAVVDADGKLPQVDATASTAASPAIAYRAATVDLSATAAAARGRRGGRATVVLHVRNAGSVTATGPVSFALSLTGGSLASALALPAVVRPVSVRAGSTKSVAVPITLPASLAAGTYTVTATLSPTTSPADADAADKTAAATLTVT